MDLLQLSNIDRLPSSQDGDRTACESYLFVARVTVPLPDAVRIVIAPGFVDEGLVRLAINQAACWRWLDNDGHVGFMTAIDAAQGVDVQCFAADLRVTRQVSA